MKKIKNIDIKVDNNLKLNYFINSFLFFILWMVLWWILFIYNQKKIIVKMVQDTESVYSKFTAVDSLLKSEYLDDDILTGNFNKMIENALVWYVNGIWDPHTVYLKREDNTELNQELHNQAWFAWIWVVIQKNDEYALIDEILKWSSAAKAWLKPLDKIYLVDEHIVKDLTAEETVWLIRWDEWTNVNLFIIRDGWEWVGDIKFRVTLERHEVKIPSVSSNIITKNGKNLLNLEVSIISSKTSSLIVDEIFENTKKVDEIDGIILDLRWNNWWYLEEATKILWHFVPNGEITLKTKYRAFEDVIYKSEWKWELSQYPLVILVDQNTASAGEIIALTLQEKWYTVIWTNSFGKGSIQALENFKDWSSLKYTVWKRYSPSDVNIDWEWISPDIFVERDYEKFLNDGIDVQLEKAEDILLKILKN